MAVKSKKTAALKEICSDIEINISKCNATVIFFDLDILSRKKLIQNMPDSVQKQIHLLMIDCYSEKRGLLERGLMSLKHNRATLKKEIKRLS